MAHFEATNGAYSYVQICEEGTSKVSASRRVTGVLQKDLLENGWKIVPQKERAVLAAGQASPA
jgi:hypothetical protein